MCEYDFVIRMGAFGLCPLNLTLTIKLLKLLLGRGGGTVGTERSPRVWKIGCTNPKRNRPKSSIKQVVTAPLLND